MGFLYKIWVTGKNLDSNKCILFVKEKLSKSTCDLGIKII